MLGDSSAVGTEAEQGEDEQAEAGWKPLRVRACVCVRVCVRACTRACMRVYASVSASVRVRMCVRVHLCACIVCSLVSPA